MSCVRPATPSTLRPFPDQRLRARREGQGYLVLDAEGNPEVTCDDVQCILNVRPGLKGEDILAHSTVARSPWCCPTAGRFALFPASRALIHNPSPLLGSVLFGRRRRRRDLNRSTLSLDTTPRPRGRTGQPHQSLTRKRKPASPKAFNVSIMTEHGKGHARRRLLAHFRGETHSP